MIHQVMSARQAPLQTTAPERFRNPRTGVGTNRVLPVYNLRSIACSAAEILLQPNERLLLGITPLTLQITVRRRGEKDV